MSHRHPRAISTIQTYHAKYVRISSQRSALCLLLTVLSAWVSSHRLRVHNDFSTWIKTIRARIYTKATECRITLPMRFTHIFFRFFCLFVCLFFSFMIFSRSIPSSSKCYFTLICFVPKLLESFSATLVLFDSLPSICMRYMLVVVVWILSTTQWFILYQMTVPTKITRQ